MLVLCRWWRARRRRPAESTDESLLRYDTVDFDETAPELSEPSTDDVAPDLAAESESLQPQLGATADAPEWAAREPGEGEAQQVTIGSASTFGSADWWTTDWWPLGSAEGDIVADFATVERLAVAGVTLRGNKHRLGGDPGEDSFHLRRATTSNGRQTVCIAVCDGVGSASRSRSGARWLARATTARLAVAVAETDSLPLSEDAARRAITDAVMSVRELADRRGIALAELQTTLAFAVVSSETGVGAEAVAGQIGDSPMFLGSDDGLRPALPFNETEGPILTTATQDALSSSPEALRTATLSLAPGDLLLVCSDGIGNFLWSSAGALDLGRHLAQSLRAPVPQLEFIRQASFDLRSADDDRTLVVLWTRPLPAGTEA